MFLITIIAISNPQMFIYGKTNNFTSHYDYSGNYLRRFTYLNPKVLSPFPEFYFDLRKKDNCSIIEVPYVAFQMVDLYHVYQRFHGKRVFVGYDGANSFTTYLYYPFMDRNLNFKNMIDIRDLRQINRSGAEFIIVHNDLVNENLYIFSNKRFFSKHTKDLFKFRSYLLNRKSRNRINKRIIEINKTLTGYFGKPFYADKWITVYEIK